MMAIRYSASKLSHRCSNLAHCERLRLTGEPEQFFESRFPSETFKLFTHLPLASLTSKRSGDFTQRPMKKKTHVIGADVTTLVPTFLPNRMRRLTIFQILQPEAPARPEIAHGSPTYKLPDWDPKTPGAQEPNNGEWKSRSQFLPRSFCRICAEIFISVA